MSTGRAHKRYLARAHAMGGHTTVPAGDAAAVLAELSNRMSYSAIARGLGTSHNYVTKVIRGEIRRMQPERYAAIIAMRDYRPGDTSHVDSLGSKRRLQALHAMGYSFSRLAREIGTYSIGAIKDLVNDRTPVVEAHHARDIRAAFDRLSMHLPVATSRSEQSGLTRARNTAQRHGWPPPLAWPEERIDDPTYTPRNWAYKEQSSTRSHLELRTEILIDLIDQGHATAEACRVLDLSRDALWKWCFNNDRSELFADLASRETTQINQYTRNVS